MECFGREREIDDLWLSIGTGRNLLMLAPRRIGKTVVLNRLRETAADREWRAVVMDVEGFHEEKDFFRQCCAAIQEELGTGAAVLTAFTDRLRHLLTGGSEGDDWRQWLVRTDWREFADHLLAHLDGQGGSPPWLILVDELPVFVHALGLRGGPSAVSDFLYLLRNLRQKYRKVRWLYTGSIGLDSVARRQGVEGALNDLEPYVLTPFSAETATAFLEDIATRRGCGMTDGAAGTIVERLGWLAPYYLEKVAEDACAHAGRGGLVGSDAARESMDRMLGLDKRTYWSTWREHLDRNFPEPEKSRLYRVLETAAKAEGGASRDVLLAALNRPGEAVSEGELRTMLDTLVADGYLLPVPGGHHAFRMNLLREWWLRYVVL